MENQIAVTSILSLLETTKDQRTSFVSQLIATLKEGNVDPLQIHLQVKNTEDLVKQITGDEEYRKICLDAAEKYGKKFEHHNAKFEIKEVGVKYDFATCNDPELLILTLAADKANAALKERQDFLKKAPASGFGVIDQESGELVTVYPPTKTSTTSIAVTLK